MSITKQGIITSPSIYESEGTNILLNSENYTVNNPYVVYGTSGDIIATTNMYAQVTPGETYYFMSQTDSEWADGHGYTASRKGKAAIWLYLSKEYNPSNTGYDNPIFFHSASNAKVKDGVWKYTIPSGYNMARVRFNTYSDGTDTVTCKFWDTMLIPERYYVPKNQAGVLLSTLEKIISQQEKLSKSKSSKGGGLE